MSLQDWLRNGWLVEHRTSRQEIADLLAVADRDLVQCRAPGLGPDWQLNIAYNAVLKMATAVLVAAGLSGFKGSPSLSGPSISCSYP